jgi:hypothetical protein
VSLAAFEAVVVAEVSFFIGAVVCVGLASSVSLVGTEMLSLSSGGGACPVIIEVSRAVLIGKSEAQLETNKTRPSNFKKLNVFIVLF